MKRKHRIVILLFLVTIVIIAIFKLWPETKAAPRSSTSITIKFSPGEKTGAFSDKEYTLKADSISNCVTIPDDFSNTIDMIEDSYYKKVDDETFYFDEEDYSYTFTGWKAEGTSTYAPMETVFQPGNVVPIDTLLKLDADNDGTLELDALWGKTIYVQNQYDSTYYTDYWILDMNTVQNYNKTGAWNYKYEDNNLILNDGKKYESPICTLDYAYYLFYKEDYKNSFTNSKSKNAYEFVIMLTGDLDYVKSSVNGKNQEHFFTSYSVYDGTNYDASKNYIFGEYVAQQSAWGYANAYLSSGNIASSCTSGNSGYAPSITFKSYNKNKYNLYINGYGYYDQVHNSIRFDGVYYRAIENKSHRPAITSPVSIGSETAFMGGKNTCLEFTKRADANGFSVLRTNCVQTVVFNGGTFPSWQTSWGSSQKKETYNYDLHWYMGQNAKINGAVTLGTTAPYENTYATISQNFRFTITGGTIRDGIYGGSYGINSKSLGKREIIVIGDKGSNIATNPTIKNIYGGAQAGKLTGEAYVDITGATNITNVYGGGCDFTATTYGNTHITIKNSIISGDVYGGGYNGDVRKNEDGTGGNVNVDISDSTVLGNIFGSGMGGTQIVNIPITMGKDQSATNWQNTQYIPQDSDFTSVKNSNNGDYDTDWSWDKPATGFPFIQENTEYICVSIYKGISWVSNNPSYLTYSRTYSFAYLSLALVENDVNITIDGSIVGSKSNTAKGNVYGGGSLAKVNGNSIVTIKNNSTIYGSVYGGGDGVTKPTSVKVYYPQDASTYVAPKYTVEKDSSGNILNVKVENESGKYGNFAYSKNFEWSNEESLKNSNGIDTDKYLIYSPNVENVGVINGNSKVVIENSNVSGNTLAGGNAADVQGNTELNITNSSINDVYGGGYSGNVGKSTTVTIYSGTMSNVFGGGNLGTVKENTTVTIGDENNSNLKISNLLYGGGRGKDENGDGDASDFTTVYGTANVKIQGINTSVENYGSITLGAVANKIDVTFKNYWTGNATSKYKTMNGIDRATNVYFENSYVLLTNKDENGNLLGIKSIENLYIPSGSGLKISANGEISGNFEGGGELYLDSEVCLTIKGNITGKTKLALNPLMYEDEVYKINGGEENPYLKVYGSNPESSDTETATALVSGDNQYTIFYKPVEECTIYYIKKDVIIDKNLIEQILLQEGKQLSASEENWNSNNVQIMQDGEISGDFKIKYQFKKDENIGNKYQNIQRSIILKSGEDEVSIPKNTKMYMIDMKSDKTKIYNYYTTSETSEIKLNEFSNLENSDEKYSEVANVAEVAVGDNVTLMYRYDEQFRIILDFSDCENYLEKNKTYNILIKVQDLKESIKEPEFDSSNIMNIHEKREATYSGKINRNQFGKNGTIKLEGNLNITSPADSTVYDPDLNKNVTVKIKLQDTNGTNINIPSGTIVKVNNEIQSTNTNYASITLSQILNGDIDELFDIDFDMSGVISDTQKLQLGKYKIVVEAYIQNENIIEKKIMSQTYDFEIVDKSGYGIDANIENTDENEDKLQLFNNDNNSKTLKIIANKGNLNNAHIKIELQKRTSSFTYTNIENTIVSDEISSSELKDENELKIKNTLESGMYRIVISLYDEYEDEYSQKVINFMVE